MLLKLIKRQAYRAFTGAVIFPAFVLPVALIVSLGDSPDRLLYGILYWAVYWLIFWLPGAFLCSWIHSLLVTPLWIRVFKLSFDFKYFPWLYMLNALIAVLVHILLSGGAGELWRLIQEDDAVSYLVVLSLLLLTITWFMVGGGGQMKRWRNSFLSFWRGD